jgi:hypothetical protein
VKIAAEEINDEEIPTASGVVSLDNINQNAYPKSIEPIFSIYRYTAPLPIWSLLTEFTPSHYWSYIVSVFHL